MSKLRTWLAGALLRKMKVPRDVQRFAFKNYPERLALSAGGLDLTYAELERRVHGLVGAWQEAGIRKGSRVLSLLYDGVDQVAVRLAANEAGVWLTQLSPDVNEAFLSAVLETLRPELVLGDPLGPQAASWAGEAAGVPVWWAGVELDERAARAEPLRSSEPLGPADPLGLGFTSGTTGPPKPILAQQGKLVQGMRMVVANVGVAKPGERPDVFVLGIPLLGAGSGAVLPALMAGSHLVLPDAYEAETIAEQIDAREATRTFVTPSTLIDLLDLPERRYRLTTLQSLIYGTESTPAAKVREALDRFGPILQQGYGSAEVYPPVTMLRPQDHVVRGRPTSDEVLASVGRVVRGVRVRILGPEGRALPAGEVGRVDVKSPTVFTGYHGLPDRTAEVLRSGWLLVGDMGKFLPGGQLVIMGREADVVRAGERALYPREVEEAAHRHPQVKEAAFVQVGDATVLAASPRRLFRERSPREFEQDLAVFLERNLPATHRPNRIRWFAELPRSPLAKVLRREVRARLQQEEVL